jgi:hypothetical protein
VLLLFQELKMAGVKPCLKSFGFFKSPKGGFFPDSDDPEFLKDVAQYSSI